MISKFSTRRNLLHRTHVFSHFNFINIGGIIINVLPSVPALEFTPPGSLPQVISSGLQGMIQAKCFSKTFVGPGMGVATC